MCLSLLVEAIHPGHLSHSLHSIVARLHPARVIQEGHLLQGRIVLGQVAGQHQLDLIRHILEVAKQYLF